MIRMDIRRRYVKSNVKVRNVNYILDRFYVLRERVHCKLCIEFLTRKLIFSFLSFTLLCVKSIRIRSFSGPYFPVFGLNTRRYSVSLCIQSECRKIRAIKTPNTEIFHAVSKFDLHSERKKKYWEKIDFT